MVYRVSLAGAVEVLIAHPGGPYWARKDEGVWSVPKGEYEEPEDGLTAAVREFREETGLDPPGGERVFLGELKQPSGKRVMVWAVEGDLDVTNSVSNTFEVEWPRGSGRVRGFPEVDRVEWVGAEVAGPSCCAGKSPSWTVCSWRGVRLVAAALARLRITRGRRKATRGLRQGPT